PDEPSVTRIVWLFSLVLGYSRLIWARFVAHQDLQTMLRCHMAAFAALGGVPRQVLYDRMKTAVIGEDDQAHIVYNRALIDFAGHYGFHPKACRPYRAKTKGKVERPFRYIREDFFLARSFRNLDDLNAQLSHWLAAVANPRVHATTQRVVNEAFAEERLVLQPLPLVPFRAVLKLERRVSHEGMVSVGGNLYSVPDATRKRVVEVHSLADEIRIFEADRLIAVHPALEVLDHAVRQLERGEASALELIDTLLAEELSVRETSRVKTALRMGRLATIKTLAGFDFSFQPSLDRERVLALAELQFVDRREVVHFLGPPGTGKSHLAVALGVEAVKAGRSVYFTTLADIVGALVKAEREGQLHERIRWFCRSALLIVDEIGYLPVTHGGGNLFFQLVNARYEKGAMILTSNRGFAEWGEVFGDPVVATALLDRLLHHAVVIQIEGSSYRLRQHADLMPEHVRSKALINAPISAQPPRRRG